MSPKGLWTCDICEVQTDEPKGRRDVYGNECTLCPDCNDKN